MKRKNGTLHSQGIFVVLFILFPSFLEAQGNSKITLYDEAGVPFRVRSNGDPKGPKEGASRLTLDSLENGRYTLLIEYPDTSIPKLEKSLELPENVGFTYSLQAIEGEEKRDWNLVSRIRTLGEKESDTTDRQRGRVPGSDGAEIPETDSAFIHS